MCISTAYEGNESGPVLAEYVAAVELQDGKVTMIDIMGKETVVNGSLKSADLTRGLLIVEPN